LAYDAVMVTVPSRHLRNDTAGILRRVEAGEEVTVTRGGRPVAKIIPLSRPRRPLRRDELLTILREAPLDPGFRDDRRRWIAPETTDDLGPIR
jgi:prevent-host-death family protein